MKGHAGIPYRTHLTAEQIKENEDKIARLRNVLNKYKSVREFCVKYNCNQTWIYKLLHGINRIDEMFLSLAERG